MAILGRLCEINGTKVSDQTFIIFNLATAKTCRPWHSRWCLPGSAPGLKRLVLPRFRGVTAAFGTLGK